MAAAEKATISSKRLKLMGPAQTNFETFLEQCIYFADMYWPNWKNYENPLSYIIPRVFSYLHPDVSEEAIRITDIETIRLAERATYSTMDRLITDRTSVEAEHLVYTALQQLIEEKVQAPMIVIHNLNIHNNQTLIRQLFPSVDEEPFKNCREYDFLIIGPAIGIIAIEVKSSQYSARRDFIPTTKLLPPDYYKGIQQLESVDALLHILSICSETDPSSMVPIKKIIFTPNLNRRRYDTWKDYIGNEARQKVESHVKDVIQWFTEDMDNRQEHSDKPPLYSMLRYILKSSTGLPFEISEQYSLLLLGFRSMISLGRTNYKLDTVLISLNESITMEHRRIVDQNPFFGQKNKKVSKYSLLKLLNRTKLTYEPKLFYLSPDQRAALEGPSKQFIVGAAGTGKTVILQAKALELLRNGEKVVVFAPKRYKQKYKELFESYGFKSFQCFAWPFTGFAHLQSYFGTYIKAASLNDMYDTKEVLRWYFERAKTMPTKKLRWLTDMNIIIDDTCDIQRFDYTGRTSNQDSNLFVAWYLMTFIGTACPAKLTWIALDPTILDGLFGASEPSALPSDLFRATMEELLSNGFGQEGGTQRIHVSTLKQVMRCSEAVYETAYAANRTLRWPSGMEPVLGHKCQGLGPIIPASEVFETVEDAMGRLWDRVRDTLRGLSREGVDMANVAVVSAAGIVPTSSFRISKVLVPIYSYFEVSSFEWPVVIFADLVEHFSQQLSNEHLNVLGYQRYRAMTRATAKLVDITMTYRLPSLPGVAHITRERVGPQLYV